MDGVEYARRIEYCWALASGVWCVGWDVWLAADGVTCGGCMWMALGAEVAGEWASSRRRTWWAQEEWYYEENR